MRFSKVYALMGLLYSAIAPAFAQTSLNFMPLGDSITEFGCWRAYLQGQLQEAGVTGVDWIGSVTDTKTCSGVSDWDRNHEGHAGYLAIDIANQYLEAWLSPAAPDIVLFHLGTNDIAQGRSTDDIIAAFGQMVDLMRASNPAVKILVCRLV
jgi:lysophospholipase L1-like esterase